MPKSIKDVMTPDPTVQPVTATAQQAAELMRDEDIGDVIVVDKKGKLFGILTDRDIVIRVLASGRDPQKVTLEDFATREVTALSPGDSVEKATRLMRDKSVRRLPVVKDEKPVGIVSLGDLAIDRDPRSVLADISAAPPDGPGAVANGSAATGTDGLNRMIPAAAVGAGLAITAGYVRNRNKKRSVKLAAKRLRKTGRRLHRSGDKAGSEITGEAAKYASAAASELRKRGKRMAKQAEKGARRLSSEAEDRAEKISKQAHRKAEELGKRTDRKVKQLSKQADRKLEKAGKRSERKAEEVRELAASGRR